METNQSAPDLKTVVCYQIFDGWEVQTMCNLQKNVHVYREECFDF